MRLYKVISLMVVFLVVMSIANLFVGAVHITPAAVINSIFNLEGPRQDFIINRSRLPRVIIAILTGSALSISGGIIQAVFRNSLASPKIIGINSGAAVAVLITSLVLGLDTSIHITIAACVGGAFSAALIYLIAELRSTSITRLLLIGVAVSFLLDAIVDLILVSPEFHTLSAPLIWLTGSLWGRGWQEVYIAFPLLVPLLCVSLICVFKMDLICLESIHARSIGVNIRKHRFFLITLATLLASVSVSVVGVLGFVGLMAPHIARFLVGGFHKALIPTAMLIGSNLVVAADIIGRAILPPIEVSTGIITALLGAPFFIYLLLVKSAKERLG